MKKITKVMADKAYHEGKPIMTDAEYDSTFGINADSMTIPDDSPWEKYKHEIPMTSLEKIDFLTADNKPDWAVVEKWMKSTKAKWFISTPKYDGCAIKLYYEKGNLVRAVTRGDGEIGEDVTRNIVKARNVYSSVVFDIDELIGEVMIDNDVFEKHLKGEYDNARNAAVGILRNLKGDKAQYLTIKYHGMKLARNEIGKFEMLKKMTLKDVAYEPCENVNEVKEFYERLLKEDRNYLADGIVLTVNDFAIQQKLGRAASGKPKFSMALKFPHPKKVTKLVKIEWSMGKIGTLTPVAIVEEVDLGVKVTRASLANLDEIFRLWGGGGSYPKRGDVVEISRRGDVIPKIEKVIERNLAGDDLVPPTLCPICKEELDATPPNLSCINEHCSARKLGNLVKWSNEIKEFFKTKGLGPERVEQIFNAGLAYDVADLYALKISDLMSRIEGVKEKGAKNILEFQDHRELPLSLFLGALNVPSIGKGVWEFLIEAGYDSLEKIQAMSLEEMSAVKNIGRIRARQMVEWLKKLDPLISKLLLVVKIEERKEKVMGKGKLSGMTFVITGTLSKTRSHFEGLIIENGGEMGKAITGKTDYLVAGENCGSKLAKAKKAGVQIINESEFMHMIGG